LVGNQVGLSGHVRVRYEEGGYYFPVQVLEDSEVAEFRSGFINHLENNRELLRVLPPKDQYVVLSETHTYLEWVYRIVSYPKVLDAVESILGENLLVWGSRWFSKMPGDKTYVTWHQDSTYWGLHPPNVTTAWIALSESIPENGCMRVVPDTHRGDLLPQKDTYAPDNALTRGQEISVEVDESGAVDIILRPGEMSLHHIKIVHSSNANMSDKPRIGIAVRYVTPDVTSEGPERESAMLVRGEDEFHNFEILDPPERDMVWNGEIPEIIQSRMKNLMPKDFVLPKVP
jgi:non-haem Fe2+, alpha-ketoglutarate-dependent halogenase